MGSLYEKRGLLSFSHFTGKLQHDFFQTNNVSLCVVGRHLRESSQHGRWDVPVPLWGRVQDIRRSHAAGFPQVFLNAGISPKQKGEQALQF